MKIINQPHFFLFTGGPGAGKTSVLNELGKSGYAVVPEVAREIIKTQNRNGGDATHNGNRNTFRDLMLKQSIIDFEQMLTSTQPVFFDRGIPDLYGYSHAFCDHIPPSVFQAVQQYRYNTKVFIFPPWVEIYGHDPERKQDFQEAIETYQAVKEAHLICGYQLIEVPKVSVRNRIEFILQMLNA
ncbi:AAA family ATPase [Legionella maioricensis]|uniref:AAA family ATPase n=1 Tax=Legionella maioricensis TaxID=2896528 RepID=A0A9X2D3D2_9GAMM|nr:AAA family ATPase [Legionella maioricensis]MCL9685305.1 AAA family ATPase [Legionella maioricensis]MCL9688560.1 AAA family ATPase [Legionella maioricensis]